MTANAIRFSASIDKEVQEYLSGVSRIGTPAPWQGMLSIYEEHFAGLTHDQYRNVFLGCESITIRIERDGHTISVSVEAGRDFLYKEWQSGGFGVRDVQKDIALIKRAFDALLAEQREQKINRISKEIHARVATGRLEVLVNRRHFYCIGSGMRNADIFFQEHGYPGRVYIPMTVLLSLRDSLGVDAARVAIRELAESLMP